MKNMEQSNAIFLTLTAINEHRQLVSSALPYSNTSPFQVVDSRHSRDLPIILVHFDRVRKCVCLLCWARGIKTNLAAICKCIVPSNDTVRLGSNYLAVGLKIWASRASKLSNDSLHALSIAIRKWDDGARFQYPRTQIENIVNRHERRFQFPRWNEKETIRKVLSNIACLNDRSNARCICSKRRSLSHFSKDIRLLVAAGNRLRIRTSRALSDTICDMSGIDKTGECSHGRHLPTCIARSRRDIRHGIRGRIAIKHDHHRGLRQEAQGTLNNR